VGVLLRWGGFFYTLLLSVLGVIARGGAGVVFYRRGFPAHGRTVEFTKSYYRGDAYDFVAELNVGPR
jgi:GntR family transcriptional regulator